jgi:hypothetical protein
MGTVYESLASVFEVRLLPIVQIYFSNQTSACTYHDIEKRVIALVRREVAIW